MSQSYVLSNCDVRSVTLKDKWCYKPKFQNGKPLKEEDWGYIVNLPFYPQEDLLLEGFEDYSIVRSKKDKSSGKILLQIVEQTYYFKNYAIIFRDRMTKAWSIVRI